MSSIASISTVLPEHSYTLPEIQAAGDIWLKDYPEQRGLFRRFLASAQVARRHFVLPVSDVISLNGLAKPAEYFEEFECLILRAGANAFFHCKMREKSLNFLFTHGFGMTHAVEANKTSCPINILFFGVITQMSQAGSLPHHFT